MKILVKYPTRSRPQLFLQTLKEYYNSAFDNDNIHYLISIDEDDATMTDDVINQAKSLGKNINVLRGKSTNKIDACNRDISTVTGWDIVVLISDDMKVKTVGWDDIIRSDMKLHFKNGDGMLWYFDGTQNRICTLTIYGRRYYNRFNYLYHPSYKSLWSDNEQTDVAKKLNKISFINRTIIKHEHPMNVNGVKNDALYIHNDKFYNEDKHTYEIRKSQNFDLAR